MSSRRPIAPALLLVLGLLLTACSGAVAPAKTRTATPRPVASTTPAPAHSGLSSVVIDGSAVTVYDASKKLVAALSYTTDGAMAVARLDTALGEKATEQTVTTDQCYPSLDEHSWGGLHLWTSSDGLTRPENARFYVTADSATTADGVGIGIPSGQRIGDTADAVLAANPKALRFENGDVYYDVVAGTPTSQADDFYGASLHLDGGRLASISAPLYYLKFC